MYSNSFSSNPEDVSCQYNYAILPVTNLEFCYNQRNDLDFLIDVENYSLDSLKNFEMGYFLDSDFHGTTVFTNGIASGATAQLPLSDLSFPGEGSYTVSVWVNASCNGVVTFSDSIDLHVVIRSPFIVDNLFDTIVCSSNQFTLSEPAIYQGYLWSTGETSNSITVDQPGNYFVSVSDGFGCESIDSIGLGFFLAPEDLGSDTVLCDGVILTADAGIGFQTYSWSNGMVSNSILISVPGLYAVLVSDTNGCNYADSISVSYATVPQPGAPSFISVCDGDTAMIGAANNFNSYLWNTGDTTSSIPIYNSGIYMITVVGNNGCIGIDTINVLVSPLPNVVFSDSVMCNHRSYVLDLGQWFPTLQWSTGDTSQNILVTSPGLYTVSVTDLNGCHSVDSIFVSNINVTVSLGPDDTICSGTSFALFPPGSFDSYEWVDGTTGPAFVVSASGTYSVTVTKGICFVSDEVTITVDEEPVANFSSQISSPDVQFTNLSNQNYNIVWDFGDGDSSVIMHPIHSYPSTGSYDVTLQVSNTCGSATYTNTVGIFPQGVGNIYLNKDLKVFPTLASYVVNFTLVSANNLPIEYAVFDVTGKLLINQTESYYGPEHVYHIDVSNFATGLYYIRIVSSQEILAVQPFIKD